MQGAVRIQRDTATSWDDIAVDQPSFVDDSPVVPDVTPATLTTVPQPQLESEFWQEIVPAGAVSAPLTAANVVTHGSATDNSSVHALRVDVARATYTAPGTGAALDGSGLKIGILSDSFNLKGGESADIANGDLPAAQNVTILKEGATGSDEGRAMAQLVHSIAPGAQIFFYTATAGEADFAQGITTLADAGCTFIVDDVSYTNEPFYEDTGVITKAVETVIAQGVNYFTAAGNEGRNYYEASFSKVTETLAGIGVVSAHNVGDGHGGTSPYESVSLAANAKLDFSLQWTQPFATGRGTGTRYDIGVAIYDQAGGLVANYSTANINGNPQLVVNTTLTNSAGTYNLVFYENVGSATPGTFKILFLQDSTATLTGVGFGVGSGASFGHEIAPGVNTVTAVNVTQTPVNGVSTPVVEAFASTGPGLTYYSSTGTLLSTPLSHNGPQFAATDGSPTSVFSPFYGTSSAAPNAAAVGMLVSQADLRLSNTQITYVLAASAVPTASAISGGAGLIQADVAVGAAVTAATTPEWQGAGGVGTGNWSSGGDWTDNIAPRATDAVVVSTGLGMLAASYTLTFDAASATVASLSVDGLSSTVVPDLVIGSGHALTVSGAVTVGSGRIDIGGTLAVGGALTAGSLATTPIAYLGSGGTIVLQASDSATLTGGFTAGISNFGAGDFLDLSGLAFSGALGVSYDGANAIVFSGDVSNVVAKVALAGAFTALRLTGDTGTGTEIVACYVRGTMILTDAGEVPVEKLQAGQKVLTLGGTPQPIVWIGRRSYAGRFLAGQEDLLPIRIRAGAIADGVPHRDLLVSPRHAMFLDGVLVAAEALVNEISIVRESDCLQVDYFHIELAQHDVIWAEGAASETYVDDDNRFIFHNAAEHPQAHLSAPPAVYCAQRLDEQTEGGHAIARLHARLAARAGAAVPQEACPALDGAILSLEPAGVSGWAVNRDAPGTPVCLDVLVDGRLVCQTLAWRARTDGALAFDCALPEGSLEARVEVRTSLDQRPLRSSLLFQAA